MAITELSIYLQASRRRGAANASDGVTRPEFIERLKIVAADEVAGQHATGAAWSASLVRFPAPTLDAFGLASPDGVDDERLWAECWFRVVGFLERREPSVFNNIREREIDVRLFLDVRMNSDQFDFDFPPALLKACARHGIGIHALSND